MNISTLVLPVAGAGTRLRPLTLGKPKALVELDRKPLLEYVLEEARESSMRDVILIASPEHRRHFSKFLEARRKSFPTLRFTLRFQERPWGNGHALVQVADLVGRKPFAMRFCDDILIDKDPSIKTLVRLHEKYSGTIMMVGKVPRKDISNYGVIGIRKRHEPWVYEIGLIAEKPRKEDIKKLGVTNLSVIGGYIITPSIMKSLKLLAPYIPPVTDALRITAAFHQELRERRPMYAWEFRGVRLDCGTLDGLRKAEEFMKSRPFSGLRTLGKAYAS